MSTPNYPKAVPRLRTPHESTLRRAEELKRLTREHYEEGNQRKCYKAIWRRFVAPLYGINYRTYLRLINL